MPTGRAGDSLSFWSRPTFHPASAGVPGNRSKLPTKESPRPKRVSSSLITHSPTCSTLDAGRTVPLLFEHQGPSTHVRNSTETAEWCDDHHIVRRFDSSSIGGAKQRRSEN